jgi:hypothetical protein
MLPTIIEAGRWRDGWTLTPPELRVLGQRITAEEVVIFRGAFAAEEMLALRRQVFAWGETTPPLAAGQSGSQPGINWHRRDDGRTPSTLPHIFHQYGFGDRPALPPALAAPLRQLSADLMTLQNHLAGTAFDPETPEFRLKVIRHPTGGGYLVPHRHPYEPQRIAIFLNLSEPGRDYPAGATRFFPHRTWMDTHASFRCGDLLAWRYDLVHDVTPIHPEVPLTWAGDDGLTIAALEMVEAHPHSHQVKV